MKEIRNFSFQYSEYASIEELGEKEQKIVRESIDAQKSSYSPYSKFSVGAAILLKNGEIVIGSNQENGAYPSGLCAERVALFSAGAKFPKVPIEMMAISASNMGKLVNFPVPPCGGCRQVMSEYRLVGGQTFPVIMVGAKKIISVDVQDLMPFNFTNPSDM